jgi:hypothetical protein
MGSGKKMPSVVSQALKRHKQLRAHLKSFEDAGVDQVAFIQQGGKNWHDHICQSLQTSRSQARGASLRPLEPECAVSPEHCEHTTHHYQASQREHHYFPCL